MNIQEKVSLKPYNTFGLDVKAPLLISITSEGDMVEACQKFDKFFVLGGGSNVLFTNDLDFPVFHIKIKGIEKIKEQDNYVWVKAYAGEIWHNLVLYTIEKGWGGLENLSLIPGTVGASVVQNIGAYGVEIKDVMESCEVFDVETLQRKTLSRQQCNLAYRESIFKREAKERYIITSVTYKLTKSQHIIRTDYGGLSQIFSSFSKEEITPKMVSDAVISIRKEKLPDPKQIGNSGSFFKNPVVDKVVFDDIIKKYPEMPYYKVSFDKVKIPAGWLIESCQMKGFRCCDAGVHRNQALVLVNYGKATGKQIYDLALNICDRVKHKFNISLEMEVNII